MEPLGRYYTIQVVSNLLVSKFQQKAPQNVLDLGVGEGSLLSAAFARWRHAQFYAIDVDPNSISRVTPKLSFAKILHIDGLSPNLPQKMNLKVGSLDVAVCNPPYLRLDNGDRIKSFLKDAALERSMRLSRMTSDLMFLAQNLRMLRTGGELGIILPDSMFTGHEFAGLREDLVNNHRIIGIIQLPDKIFANTEARTHILLLDKGGLSASKIPLYKSNTYGELGEAIFISKKESIYRMDYSYYVWKRHRRYKNTSATLKDLNVEIKRGSQSKKELEHLGIQCFHTSSFPDSLHSTVKLNNAVIPNTIIAEPGDILIARVGKRCMGRVTMVDAGCQVISDCVYRLRASNQYSKKIRDALISREGQQWLQAHAHGVCAQVISKKDLLSFEVEV